jgi:hypothetical protein
MDDVGDPAPHTRMSSVQDADLARTSRRRDATTG